VQDARYEQKQLQNTEYRRRVGVGSVSPGGARGASVGLGGSLVVDLLEKRHAATFFMEACRRHRDLRPSCFGRREGIAIPDYSLILQRSDMRGGGGGDWNGPISTAAHNRRGGATARLLMWSALGRRRQMGDGDRRAGGLLRYAWGKRMPTTVQDHHRVLEVRIIDATAVVQAQEGRVEVTTTSTVFLVRPGERRPGERRTGGLRTGERGSTWR
jgi:hypothetical protein